MRSTSSFCLILTVALLAIVGAPSNADAQQCPWCITPTICSQVSEDTDIAGCYNAGQGCKKVEGECNVSLAFKAQGGPERLLAENGLEYHGTVAAEIWGQKMQLTAINDDLFAEWGCSGQLAALFRRDEHGRWLAIDPKPFSERFRLKTLTAVASTASPGVK